MNTITAPENGATGEADSGYECLWLDTGTGEVILGLKKGLGIAPATADEMAAQLLATSQSMAIGQPWGCEGLDLDDPCEAFMRSWDRAYGG